MAQAASPVTVTLLAPQENHAAFTLANASASRGMVGRDAMNVKSTCGETHKKNASLATAMRWV